MTESRRPVHLAVLLTASAGLYSVSLAGVTLLQSHADRATIEAHRPIERSLAGLAGTDDRIEDLLDRAAAAYARSADGYDELAPELAAVEGALDELGAAVEEVNGSAAALPNGVRLPALQRSTTVVRRTVTVHATTGASG